MPKGTLFKQIERDGATIKFHTLALRIIARHGFNSIRASIKAWTNS